MRPTPISSFKLGTLAVEVYKDREALGQAAATVVANRLRDLARQHESVPMIFATGQSQYATLRALTAIPDVPWNQVVSFHMDEYVGFSDDHPASLRRYLHENLTSRVKLRRSYEIEGAEARRPDDLPGVRRLAAGTPTPAVPAGHRRERTLGIQRSGGGPVR